MFGAHTRLAEQEVRRQLRRAVAASTVGTWIEWYDITLYGILAPLYISRLYFPAHDPLASYLAGFLGLLVSFGARPIGGAVFGHFGDRIGRKATLIVTLALGGVSSFLIGLVPTYAEIGVAAPVILLALRVLVGGALGGEWGGATLLTLEWSNRSRRRGWWSAWPQVGVTGSMLLGYLALTVSMTVVGPASYWAWRWPFLASIVLLVIGVYLRLGVLETPTFAELLEKRRIVRWPVLTVLRGSWRTVALVAMLRMGEQGPLLIFTTFFLVYGTVVLHLPRETLILISIVAGAAGLLAPPVFGGLSDLVGRRRVFVAGAVLMLVYGLPYFQLLNSRSVPTIMVASALAQVLNGMTSGPLSAYIAEQFTGTLRYSGASVGAGVGAFLSGGLASALATVLLQTFRSSIPISIYIMVGCAISLLAAAATPDRRERDLSVEYSDETAGDPAVATARA